MRFMKSNRTSSLYEFEIFLFQFDDMMLVIYYIYTLIREIISNAEGPCLACVCYLITQCQNLDNYLC